MVLTRARRKSQSHEIRSSECRFDPEGEWPLEYDKASSAVGVFSEHWDSSERGPRLCVISLFLKDLICVDSVGHSFRPRMQVLIDWCDDGILKQSESKFGEGASYWSGGYEVNLFFNVFDN
jgi:hypothetical protein